MPPMLGGASAFSEGGRLANQRPGRTDRQFDEQDATIGQRVAEELFGTERVQPRYPQE